MRGTGTIKRSNLRYDSNKTVSGRIHMPSNRLKMYIYNRWGIKFFILKKKQSN